MVPANRNIDGFPAYAQCAGSTNSAIYSNNGIDTSTTQMGSDWVRTQWSGGYQCTELAHRYLYFKWQVKWIPNGNAGAWCDTQPPANSGLVQTMTPVHGDIMVLGPGSCGADMSTGHVNVIDVVNGDKLVAVEQNGARRGTYQLSCAKCFLHVMANDGTATASTTAPTSQGAAGKSAGAAGSGSSPRPSGASAGAAAPTVRPFAASAAGAAATPVSTTMAAASPVASTAPPTAATSSVKPPQALTAGAAGGLAAAPPLTGSSTSTRVGAPAQSSCAVMAGPGTRPAGFPIGLAIAALSFGLLRRPLRRTTQRARRGNTNEPRSRAARSMGI
jgi:hypothetical protein